MANSFFPSRAQLLAGAAVFGAIAAPAYAQDAVTAPAPAAAPEAARTPAVTQAPAPAGTQAPAQGDTQNIVVTGSILRGGDTGISPVTTLSAANLDARGINTVQDAIQQLSSNNGAALTNSFTANGAFAAGASAVSLRGLSTSSTLVLFDGLRAAYYPLADDGSRNFVDLNTIPDDIVDRIEVLRDGASASYGADAIAGVVNVITKRKFEGVSGRAEAGISERGFGANQRLTLTAGTGDLDEKGYNAYVSGFYFRSSEVRSDDLPAPFNSDDRRGIGGPNNIINGQDADGALGAFGINGSTLYVRPGTTGRYQILNPAAGCAAGPSVTPNATELAANATLPVSNVCQEDFQNQYGIVSPKIERFGGSARFTAKVGDTAEAYLAVNFQQTSSAYSGDPAVIRGNAPAGILYPQFSTSSGAATLAAGSGILTLPVYVCAGGVNCTAANGRLNPNNPFAANGQTAELVGRSPTGVTTNETRSRVYRGAMGISGTAFGDWDYKVDATAMHTDLERRQGGYVYIQHLLDVIADGSYNFVNPSLNSAATNAYLTPESIVNASSDLYQAQATVSKTLFDLPGGPLQLGLGGSIFYEAIDAPSGNPDTNGPTERYFTLNAFGTVGHRTVSSAFFELNAPVIDRVELSASGRYDHYSTGQSNFSPKAGFKVKPIEQVTLRGTYSRGFRIPSFAEANALPTTGYVTQQISSIPDAFLAQYGANCSQQNQAGCPTYLTTYSIGNTTLASPDLKPEKSRSFTGGIVLQPIRQISLTVDYFNIKKTGAITSPSIAPAIAAYYAGEAIPTGFNVIADAADVNNPNARPRIGFVQSTLINSDTQNSEGIDFGANGRFDLGPVRWTTNLNASWLLNLSTTSNGVKEKYVGTLGNFSLTAGSGTFEWKGNWTNTFEYDKVAISGTVNYTDGYDLSAQDQGDAYKDCGQSPGYTGCHVKSYVTFDLNAAVNVTDKVQIYFNALNVFDRLPALDPVTYGAYLYNAVQAGQGIYGRSFRAGAKFGF